MGLIEKILSGDIKSLDDLTWRCEICNQERPNANISVVSKDISRQLNTEPGSAFKNLRYCNDKIECTKQAKEFLKNSTLL